MSEGLKFLSTDKFKLACQRILNVCMDLLIQPKMVLSGSKLATFFAMKFHKHLCLLCSQLRIVKGYDS